jgi:hypothetical protein
MELSRLLLFKCVSYLGTDLLISYVKADWVIELKI